MGIIGILGTIGILGIIGIIGIIGILGMIGNRHNRLNKKGWRLSVTTCNAKAPAYYHISSRVRAFVQKKYPDASQRRDIFFVESPLRIFGF